MIRWFSLDPFPLTMFFSIKKKISLLEKVLQGHFSRSLRKSNLKHVLQHPYLTRFFVGPAVAAGRSGSRVCLQDPNLSMRPQFCTPRHVLSRHVATSHLRHILVASSGSRRRDQSSSSRPPDRTSTSSASHTSRTTGIGQHVPLPAAAAAAVCYPGYGDRL